MCGQKGHCAGFIGAKYVDCPNKPCYLCGQSGHSTMTCPYRADPGHGCAPAGPSTSTAQELAGREAGEAAAEAAFEAPSRAWHVDAAALRLHDKRVTCLEFHPSNDALVLSGSKGGRIAVWDMDRVYERTVYRDINRWQTMGLKFLPGGDAVATCSQDGTVKARAWSGAGGGDADGAGAVVDGYNGVSVQSHDVALCVYIRIKNNSNSDNACIFLLSCRCLMWRRGCRGRCTS